MILIGLGANLPSTRAGPPRASLLAALEALQASGIMVVLRSHWYESAPVPASEQPWFVNAVAALETALAPDVLMQRLHDAEADLGRVRDGGANAPRAADLDLLDYHGRVNGEDAWPRLPHPRMHERAFVLKPLAEIAPDWRHPLLDLSAAELLDRVPAGQVCRRLPGALQD